MERLRRRGPDIVYPVRNGDFNEELRYSLRSLSNIPHNRVWIIGYCPSFVDQSKVNYWPRPNRESKYRNATNALEEITREIGTAMTRPFLLMNDDFYIMQPMDRVPVHHMGPLEEVIAWYKSKRHMGAYWRGMVATYDLLRSMGYEHPLSYELHVPIPIYRKPLLEAWKAGRDIDVLHIRTMYGNMAHLGGTYMEDVKVYHRRVTEYEKWPFLSSNDNVTFQPMRGFMRERFPIPSPYEYR